MLFSDSCFCPGSAQTGQCLLSSIFLQTAKLASRKLAGQATCQTLLWYKPLVFGNAFSTRGKCGAGFRSHKREEMFRFIFSPVYQEVIIVSGMACQGVKKLLEIRITSLGMTIVSNWFLCIGINPGRQRELEVGFSIL